MTLMETLSALDGQESDGTRTYIARNGNFLSGIPYLWSAFGERAYIFASEQQARDLITQYPNELSGASIGHFPH